MFSVIYRFKVKAGQESAFVEAWEELTKLIYQYEGSLGSKLHRESIGNYVAYAQWPSKERWENSGSNMPIEANQYRSQMKDACIEIETLYELDDITDLLKSEVFK